MSKKPVSAKISESKKADNLRRVTLKDVAKVAEVHVATASRAMSDSPLIPEATRAKVQAAAAQLGYQRDPMLQALISYRKRNAEVHYHGTIAWVLTDQHHDESLYQNLRSNFDWALEAARPLGYQLEEFHLDNPSPERLFRQLAARGIKGILFPPQSRPGVRLKLDLSGFAAVRIGETLEVPRLHTVLPDQFGNTLLMLEKLREAGWRRIGFYVPKVIDSRTAGKLSAAYWRWQQDLPENQRLEVGLPPDYDEEHFAQWFRRVRPNFIVGLPAPLEDWLRRMKLKSVPVAFPGSLSPNDTESTQIAEDWPTIYLSAIRLLDGMLRHNERGLPSGPRRITITGHWVPGRWGKGPRG